MPHGLPQSLAWSVFLCNRRRKRQGFRREEKERYCANPRGSGIPRHPLRQGRRTAGAGTRGLALCCLVTTFPHVPAEEAMQGDGEMENLFPTAPLLMRE